jgi:peptidylprolyl isomerase
MAQAKNGDTVKVHYTGKFSDGTVFDTSADREPLEFAIGEGQVIPGFELAVDGMSVGDTKTVTIPASQAYGEYDDTMVMEVERVEFPEDLHPEVGDQLQMTQPDGDTFIVAVTRADEKSVTLDANHPLAGKDLIFDIKLESIA